MPSEQSHPDATLFRRSLYMPVIFVCIAGAIKVLEILGGFRLTWLGVRPRTFEGLDGILTMPFIHGDFTHFLNNAGPIIALGASILFFYRRVAYQTFAIIWILSGLGVWLCARGSNHIGASGLVFGFASFLIVSGLLRSDRRSLALALIVVFFYGGMIWGILPGQIGVSWEGHLFGALSGILAAFLFKDIDPPIAKDPWADEEQDPEVLKYEVWNDK